MTDTYLTRQTLLKKLKLRLDESSWDEFNTYYGKFIYSVINTLGVNHTDADDISQQVMLKIWNSIDKFNIAQKSGGFRNWIYTITKNTTLNYIAGNKSKSSRDELLTQDLENKYSTPEVDELIDEEWNKHISTLAFEKISKKASKKAMDVFIAQFNGESAEQTAERLGIEVTTVYIYRGRIKEKLVAEIKNLREMLE